MAIFNKIKRLSAKLSNVIDRESAPPPLLEDLRRNFDVLLVGGTRLWESYRFDSSNDDSGTQFMLAARPCRSMEGQWWTLQHMHSYLRTDGIVVMTIDLGDRTHRALGFSYGDARTFHPLANKSLGLRYSDAIRSRCCRFYPGYSAVLLSVLVRQTNHRRLPIPRFWVCGRPAMKQVVATIRDASEFLAVASPFCKERNLRLHAAIVLPDRLSKNSRGVVEDICFSELSGVSYGVYPHPAKIIEAIRAEV